MYCKHHYRAFFILYLLHLRCVFMSVLVIYLYSISSS